MAGLTASTSTTVWLGGYGWWPDEQPSPQIKEKVERVLEERNWQVDVVFSHTCPLKYEPVEVFLPGIDQSTVDKSTEEWLDTIESKLHYERWYCGHYHTEKQVDKLRFMFEDYALLPHTLSIEEEKALIAKMERQAEMAEAWVGTRKIYNIGLKRVEIN